MTRRPSKRLIVFAGVNNEQARLEALANKKPDAVMVSFELIRKGGAWWHDNAVPILNTWRPLIYLDSGAFTFQRSSSKSRIKPGSQPKSASKKASVVDVIDFKRYFDHLIAYLAFLHEHLDEFDYVIELDADLVSLQHEDGRIANGLDVTHRSREMIQHIAGDKLIPVWHPGTPDPAYQRYRKLINDYKYVAIGSDVRKNPWLRHLIHEAHAVGTLVHGLGTSKADILEAVPYDTVDSTTWLSSLKFGQFAGWAYARDTKMSPRAQSKAIGRFEALVRELGYDPKVLLSERGGHARERYEVAIALMLERQRRAPTTTKGRKPVPLL